MVHDEPHQPIQQRQIDLLVDLRRVTIAKPPRLARETRRLSCSRVDGVDALSDAIDANLKFLRDADSATFSNFDSSITTHSPLSVAQTSSRLFTPWHHLYTNRGGGSLSAGLTQFGKRWPV